MVIVLMLITGEMILGSLALEDDDVMIIQDPFRYEIRSDREGNRSMVMYRYNEFSLTNRIEFGRDKIVSYYEANEDFAEYYYYSLDFAIKFRDELMTQDVQRGCDYLQKLIDNGNKVTEDMITTTSDSSGNTIH